MSLSLYSDLTKTTGPLIYSSVGDIVNDAGQLNYGALHWMWRGQEMANIVQGGSDIRDVIYLSLTKRSRAFSPIDSQTYSQPQSLTTWTVPWRERIAELTYAKETVMLNSSSDSTNGRAQKIKDYFTQLEREVATDQLKDLDDTFWAVPDKTKMEAATGKEPYSLPVHINEFANGLPSAAHPGGVWTTKQQIDPTAAGQTNWQAFRQTYKKTGAIAAAPAAGDINIITAFDKALRRTDFKPPPIKSNFFDGSNGVRVVFTSLIGEINLVNSLRLSNDRWEKTSDPMTGFYNLYVRGIPIIYCSQLDTAAIFPTGAAAVLSTELDTANATPNAGPRYLGVNSQYIRPVVHRDMFFSDQGEMKDPRMPTTCIHPILTMMNLPARSLQRHFIIYPNDDIVNFGV